MLFKLICLLIALLSCNLVIWCVWTVYQLLALNNAIQTRAYLFLTGWAWPVIVLLLSVIVILLFLEIKRMQRVLKSVFVSKKETIKEKQILCVSKEDRLKKYEHMYLPDNVEVQFKE